MRVWLVFYDKSHNFTGGAFASKAAAEHYRDNFLIDNGYTANQFYIADYPVFDLKEVKELFPS